MRLVGFSMIANHGENDLGLIDKPFLVGVSQYPDMAASSDVYSQFHSWWRFTGPPQLSYRRYRLSNQMPGGLD